MPRRAREKPEFRLRKASGRGNWYISYTFRGRPERISTGTADEAAARQVLADFVAGWDAPPADKGVTVNFAMDAYLEHKKAQIAGNKQPIRNYRELKYTLKEFRNEMGPLEIVKLNRRSFVNLTHKWQKEGYSNGTIRKRMNIITAVFNHARKEQWISAIPHVEKPLSPPSRDKRMDEAQVKAFVKSIKVPHVKLFVLLALHTLSRKSAILELTWDRVDMAKRRIDFNVPGRIRHNKRRVAAPIGKALYAALEEAVELAQTDYVVEYGSRKVVDIQRGFKEAAKQAKMAWVTPHVLRHTGATLLASQGVPLWEIAGLMGDSIVTVERNYAKHSPQYLKNPVATLDKIYA